ncbi:unnamed protein product [Danaus chrysippus]|uniref:(African queen) hypothetical protein n=1 Tax=Danaus chrysippus TaxID=151541 RepID=A0A8J2W4E2_9NEOP|nr:unnamed protein product [Danaus chrysippus]
MPSMTVLTAVALAGVIKLDDVLLAMSSDGSRLTSGSQTRSNALSPTTACARARTRSAGRSTSLLFPLASHGPHPSHTMYLRPSHRSMLFPLFGKITSCFYASPII